MSIRRPTPRILNIVFAAAVLVCVSALTGCASFWTPVNGTTTGGNTGTGDFVYVGKNGANTLAGYQIGTGGSLTAITGTQPTLPSAPTSIVISPNNDFLYVGTAANGSVSGGIYGYSISSTGTLTALSGGQALATVGGGVGAIDISPDGNWLVAVVTSPALNSSIPGYLWPLSTTTGLFGTVAALTTPGVGTGEAVQFAPNEVGASVSTIAASFGTAGIYFYTFSPGNTSVGNPAPISSPFVPSTAPANANFNGLIWNSAGTAIFFVGGGTDQTLYGLPVTTSTGAIGSQFSSIATGTAGTNPTALTFDASGDFLYVTNQGTSGVSGTPGTTIAGFSVGTNSGVPTFTTLSPPTFSSSGSGPGAIINAGPYILLVDQTGPPDLVLYSLDPTNPGRIFVTSSETTSPPLAFTSGLGGPGVTVAATN